MSWTVDSREFNLATAALARESVGTNREIVTVAGRDLIFSLAANTPKKTGNARAGWAPAWRGLRRTGSPGRTRRKEGRNKVGKQIYLSRGGFVDGRNNRDEPFVEMSNNAQVISRGKSVNYLFIVNAKDDFMERATNRAVAAMDRVSKKTYDKLLRKYGSI